MKQTFIPSHNIYIYIYIYTESNRSRSKCPRDAEGVRGGTGTSARLTSTLIGTRPCNGSLFHEVETRQKNEARRDLGLQRERERERDPSIIWSINFEMYRVIKGGLVCNVLFGGEDLSIYLSYIILNCVNEIREIITLIKLIYSIDTSALKLK